MSTAAGRGARIAYSVLRYVTVALFFVFAAAVFGFYGASAVDMNTLLGSTESIGSVYSMYDGVLLQMPELENSMLALIVVASVQAVIAAAALFLSLLPRTRDIEIVRDRVTLGSAVSYLSFVFYIFYIIAAAVIMSKITSFDDGAGLLEIGACPKLLLAFAIVFFVLSAGAGIVRFLLGRYYPELPIAESTARAERRKKYAPEFTVTDGEVTKVPLLFYVERNVKLSRLTSAMLWINVAATVVCFGFLIQLLGGDYEIVPPLVSPHSVVAICVGVCAVASVFAFAVPVKAFLPEEFLQVVGRKKPKKKDKGVNHIGKFVFYFVLWFIFTAIAVCGSFACGVAIRAYIIYSAFALVVGVCLILLTSAVDKRNIEIAKYLFGTVAPMRSDAPTVDYDPERERVALGKYKAAVRQGCAPRETDGENVKKLGVRRIKTIVASVATVAAAVVAAVVMPISVDRFSAGYVGSMPVYNNTVPAEFMFGKADETTEVETGKNEYGAIVETTYEYFGGEYKKLYKKAKELQEKLESAVEAGDAEETAKLTEQAATAELRLSELVHDYLKVVCVRDGFGKTDEIILEKNRCMAKPTAKKTVKSITLTQYDFLIYGNIFGADVHFECYYTDGSYKYSSVPTSALSAVDMSKTGELTLSWSDNWGDYSADIRLVDTVDGTVKYDNGKSFGYTLSIDEQTSTAYKPVVELSLYGKSHISIAGLEYWDLELPWKPYIEYITRVEFDKNVSELLELFKYEQRDAGGNIYDYYSLESVQIDEADSAFKSVGGAVYNKDVTELIFVPRGYAGEEFAVPNTVTKIRRYAFGVGGFIESTVPTSNIKSVFIPKSVVEIEGDAFAYGVWYGIKFYAQAAARPVGWNIYDNIVFGCSAEKHDYTFETNGGSSVENICGAYIVEEFPIPTKDGYIFGGWYDDPQFSGTPQPMGGDALTVPYKSESDVTLYAKWVSSDAWKWKDGAFGAGSEQWTAIKVELTERYTDGYGRTYYTASYEGRIYNTAKKVCWYVYIADKDGRLSADTLDHSKDCLIYDIVDGKSVMKGPICEVKAGHVYYIAAYGEGVRFDLLPEESVAE